MKTIYASDLAKSLSVETNRAIAQKFLSDFYIPAQEVKKVAVTETDKAIIQTLIGDGIQMIFVDTIAI